ncbi:efflux transporter outer membrane subunit [Advenella mimigardefordensis]|nr:efflux transporter outer membrane subunit [Advenella mimigardefordensis]
MNYRFSTLTFLSLLVAGCTVVGPDYQTPADAVIKRPSAQGTFVGAQAGKVYSDAPLPAHWWRLNHDPVLDQLIDKALNTNANLRAAQANLASARAAVAGAQAQQSPVIDVNAATKYGHSSGLQQLQPDLRPPDRWSYSSGLNIAYQVDLFGQIHRAIEASQQDEQAATATYEAARVTVAAETARAYAAVCAGGMQLASAQKSVRIQQESSDIANQLWQAGRGTQLDVTRARGQVQQLRADLPTLKAQQQVALFRLATLTGEAPSAMPASLFKCATPPRFTGTIPVGNGQQLLRRRPDIRAAERKLAAATARIGVAIGQLYPTITLGLATGSAGPMSMLGNKSTTSLSIGPLISWTLPNTGAAQAAIAQARATADAEYAHFDATVLNALQETESALVIYARQLERHAALKAARDTAAQAASQASALYQAGKTDYLPVLDAQRTLASADSALAASLAQLADMQIDVFLALGGGWE